MGVDTSIYANMLRPPKSVQDYDNERMARQQNQLALSLGQQKADEYARSAADANRLRSVVSGFGSDHAKNYNSLLEAGNIDAAQKYLKSNADIGETQGKVAKQKVELVDAKLKQSRNYLETVQTPEQYIAWHEANHKDPILGPELEARGVTADQARASIMQALQTPGGFNDLLNKSKLGIEKFTEMNKPTVHIQNLGGASRVISTPGMGGPQTVLSNTPITQDANSIASNATAMRGQDMSAATAAAGRAQADQRARELAAQKSAGKPTEIQQKLTDAKSVVSMLDTADGLLNQATSSYIGAGVDQLARGVGYSTEGAQASAQLKALEGGLIAKMPKMSGPQSDKDVLLYRQMAGQIGDATLPVETRRAAMKTVRDLNQKYINENDGTASGKKVVRTGISNGRKVVQYSDGSVDYAN